MAPPILVSGWVTCDMGMASKSGQMAQSMKANGNMTRQQAKADWITLRMVCMKGSGKNPRLTVTAASGIQMARSTSASGSATSSTELALRPGRTAANTRASTAVVASMGKDIIPGQLVPTTKANSEIMIFMVLVFTIGKMDEYMTVSGRRIGFTARESSSGPMGAITKDNTIVI